MEVVKTSFTPAEYRTNIHSIADERRKTLAELVKKDEITIDQYHAANRTIDSALLLTEVALDAHESLPLLCSLTWIILQFGILFFNDTKAFDNLSKAMATLLEMVMTDMVSGDELCVKRGKKIIHQGNNIKH